jgi:hypothetical protein
MEYAIFPIHLIVTGPARPLRGKRCRMRQLFNVGGK